MSRHIDPTWLYENVQEQAPQFAEMLKNLILVAPSIDVVRCGECKKANTSECSLSYWDDDWGEWRVGYAGDNWYCADGERKSHQ